MKIANLAPVPKAMVSFGLEYPMTSVKLRGGTLDVFILSNV